MTELKARRLIWHGVFLFFLGLVVGLIIPLLENPRMGLSAHMEGILNGLFLLVLGLIWNRIRLSKRVQSILFWLALYGTYMNLASTLLAAVFGHSRSTPIAGAGFQGEPWQENLVDFGLFSLTAAMLVVCIIVLWGLRNGVSRPGSSAAQGFVPTADSPKEDLQHKGSCKG